MTPPRDAAHLTLALQGAGSLAASADLDLTLSEEGYAVVEVTEELGLVDGTPEVGDPSLGMNLADVADWSTQQPFLDVMKSARPWVAHESGQWGAWSNEALAAGGYLSPEGWPREAPRGSTGFETLVLTEQPEGAVSLAGTYLLRWEGRATVSINGIARDVRREGRAIRFDYSPSRDGTVLIGVTDLDPTEPFRNMTLVREDRLALHEGGAVFNPDFLARVRDFRALRYMDWMKINNSPQVRWDDRPRMSDASWMQRGVPLEVMVQLANEIGADPWFTIPHQANDEYVSNFAAYVHDALDPRLKVYAEWSNEVWNFSFQQSNWAVEQATERWGVPPGGDAWMQFAGLRAAEVADIWGNIFGDEAERRLVRVIGVQTGWKGLEHPLLHAPLAVAEGRAAPVASFDAYAVTGYFGHSLGSEEMAPRLTSWLDRGVATREVTTLARSDLTQLTDDLWAYHLRVAREHGLQLVAYEGGTHIAGHGPVMENEEITEFFTSYSFSPEMASLYENLLMSWRAMGGTLFMAYSDVAYPSRYGSWGALRHLDDSNPRWEALRVANLEPADWERRDEGAFDNGVIRSGSESGETLTGTPEEDDLLGHDGDDVLVSRGGADRLHGGDGRDLAVLPGPATGWVQVVDGNATLLSREGTTIRLTDVEVVRFEETVEEVELLSGD